MTDITNPEEPANGPGPASSGGGRLDSASARLVAVLEILLCSSVPTQLFIGLVLSALGLPARGPDGLSFAFVVWISLLDTLVLVGLMTLIVRAHGESPWALWRGSRPILRELALGLGLVPVAVVVVGFTMGAIRQLAPWLHNVAENPLELLAAAGPGAAAIFGLMAIVAGGIREELQRAFLLQRFERYLGGTTVGIALISVAFGLGHLLQGWDAAIATGALGAFWAIVYVRRRSSVAPIVSHAGFNTIEVLRIALGL